VATASGSADLVVSLVTRGAPTQLTGGHLFHQRLAERAPAHRAELRFVQARITRDPLGRSRTADATADATVIDSLAAAPVAPWLLGRRRRVAAMIHQEVGGVGHHRVSAAAQARLDLVCYRRCQLLMASSATLVVVEPGCDLPAVTGPLPELRQGRRVAVLCVANWSPAKGIVDLLDAVAATPPPDVTLHLVGDDDADAGYAATVHARLARPELADRVVRHGPLPPAQVAAMYRAADAFAVPSYAESYGMAVAEALVAGLPVVAWAAGNVPHLVTDGRNGCLLAPGDVLGLAEVLARLATDDAWRAALGAAARQRGALLPTWDAAAATFYGAVSALVRG
jgi:glycosyltransferase involved in cell wall biosynthesis